MELRWKVLHGVVFSVVWLTLAGLLVDVVTHHGTTRVLGLGRQGLLVIGAFIGGLAWAAYYAVVLRDRDKGLTTKHHA